MVEFGLGDIVEIPLEGGGTGYGLIARASHEHVFLYGFPPRDANTLSDLRMQDAVHFSLQVDYAIHTGDWPVVSRVSEFAAQDWLMPPFRSRRDMKRVRVRVFSENFCWKDYWSKELPQEDDAHLPVGLGVGGALWMSAAIPSAMAGSAVRVTITDEVVRSWRRSLAILAELAPFEVGESPDPS